MEDRSELQSKVLRVEKTRRLRDKGVITNDEFIEDSFHTLVGGAEFIDDLLSIFCEEEVEQISRYAKTQLNKAHQIAVLYIGDYNNQEHVRLAVKKVENALHILKKSLNLKVIE